MFWLVVIGLFACFYYIHQLEKRIREVESTRGQGYSHWFRVEVSEAVRSHPKFPELSGLKTIGKSYDEWAEDDKQKWSGGYGSKLSELMSVNITYVANENAFYVRSVGGGSHLVLREDNTNLIYSEVIAGESRHKESLVFEIYDRLTKDESGKYMWMITPCLKYKDGQMLGGKREFTKLCEFPFLADDPEKYCEQCGFEVKSDGGDDIYEDSFGEKHSLPRTVTYAKNGVEIVRTY